MTDSQDQASRRKAAARWFAELQAGDLEPDTWAAFAAWEKDPLNARAFQEIEAAVGIIDRLPGALAEDAKCAATTSTAGKRRLLLAGLAAAAACVLAGIAVSYFVSGAATEPDVYRTEVGERREFVLKDGSSVLLNTDTELRMAYTNRARSIRLIHGEALFRVEPSARPFVVEASGTETRALGTEFDVRADAGEISVTLYEGSVLVTSQTAGPVHPAAEAPEGGGAEGGIRLSPGERVTLAAGAEPMLGQVDLEAARSWRDGIVRFSETALGDAVEEMNRYSATQIVIVGEALANERISGSFAAGKQEEFAESLALTLPLEVQRGGPAILLVQWDE